MAQSPRSQSPRNAGLPRAPGDHAETLIFVDVDGVLNIGINDPGNPPLEFSATNAERAMARWDMRESHAPAHRDCIERIVSTYTHELGHGEGSTYAKLVSAQATSLSDVLVERLAQIIHAAGKRRLVVLSSTWRWPKHSARVRRLEEAVSRHLGTSFCFDARTALREDRSAESRLQCIAEFAGQHCQKSLGPDDRVRILVLEDFHVTPLGSWYCGQEKMDSEETVERFLRSRVPVDASVKLIHTYDTWKTPTGLRVQVGAGLTKENLCRALSFLGGTCEHCAASSLTDACKQPAGMATLMQVGAGGGKQVEPSRGVSAWLKLPDFLVPAGLRTVQCVG